MASIEDPAFIKRILEHLERRAEQPPLTLGAACVIVDFEAGA